MLVLKTAKTKCRQSEQELNESLAQDSKVCRLTSSATSALQDGSFHYH